MEQQSIKDEIMKYKELLDERIITEEEFTIKEKELLRKPNKIINALPLLIKHLHKLNL
jgi:hypothetical protein